MALKFSTNLGVIGSYYLESLQTKVLQSTFQNKLFENPYYPSLYSLTDTFRKYNIDTDAYEIPAENVHKLDAPFIAYLQNQTGNDFALVTEINDVTVSYLSDVNKKETISLEKFLHHYKGYVLVAEPNELSGDPNYTAELKKAQTYKQKAITWYIALVLLFVLAFVGNASWFAESGIFPYLSISIIKFFGVIAASLLLTLEIDKDNTLVKNICSATKKTNCNAVLESKAAKFLGLGWSEIGFIYFAASLVFLLIPTLSLTTKFAWLAIANAIAVPYVLFSIYYQWKVVKQWCTLCLVVQAVLVTELLWSLMTFWTSPVLPVVELSTLLTASFATILPAVIWFGLKPILKATKEFTLYKAAYKRVQYNADVFNNLLVQQSPAPEGHEQIGISIGNPEASNTIIKVCSPYCGPCAKAHPELEELVKHNKDVKVKIIFLATNEEHDSGGVVAKHLLAIAQNNNIAQTQKALDDWYLAKDKNYDVFASKYKMNGEVEKQAAHLDAMSKWCDKAAIAFTPTFYVNGHKLPEGYSLDDLKEIF